MPLMTVLLEAATPGPWPVLGPVDPSALAILVVDVQRDFCDGDGWFGSLGFDLTDCQRAVEAVRPLVEVARSKGTRVVLTRQGNAPDLSDLPPARLEQGRRLGSPVGTPGTLGRALIRGEAGWDVLAGLARPGDLMVDKPGFSSFVGTGLDSQLREWGVSAVAICGVTANVCVLATLLSAVDLGYDCLLLADGVGAASTSLRESVLSLVGYQGGLFGCTATCAELAAALG